MAQLAGQFAGILLVTVDRARTDELVAGLRGLGGAGLQVSAHPSGAPAPASDAQRVYLELTGDDLLETGVRVMARPPGKRNSSIQLLSGGEKAMTAVALLLALFQLNPAPFCMLDEVDAPLDDANVGRFVEVVREMSGNVQFIIITHNKITMELAEQLHGVTMQEPGVSRLVSVDIEQAMGLAATKESATEAAA